MGGQVVTVALRIWPLMLVITITDLVFLVYIAGLSGGYVFIAIFINFFTTYVVLWKTTKVTQKEDSEDRKEHAPKEEIPRLAIENEKDALSEEKEEPESSSIKMSALAADIESQEEDEKQTETKTEAVLENGSKEKKSEPEKKAKGEEESFLFTASVCSTWIPSVVGDPEQRFFLKAGEVFGLFST